MYLIPKTQIKTHETDVTEDHLWKYDMFKEYQLIMSVFTILT